VVLGLARFFGTRHRIPAEAALVAGLYAVYESARGLMDANRATAVAHARSVASAERRLHVFVEPNVQHFFLGSGVVVRALGVLYVSAHLAVTVAVLAWLYARRPALFVCARSVLLAASIVALAGYLFYPTAPPRLAGIGIADTVTTSNHLEIQNGLVGALYNPYAAMPSMHFGYALIVALALRASIRRRLARAVVCAYPLLILLAIVATGNHFLLDAAAGALIAGLAWAGVRAIAARGATTRSDRLRQHAHGRAVSGDASAEAGTA
jgi:hypothetical protein